MGGASLGWPHPRPSTYGLTHPNLTTRPTLTVIYSEDMLADALICPVCSGRLNCVAASPGETGSSLACGQGHSFDIARQGYVSLTVGAASRPRGDTAAMVRARAQFLAGGHYRLIAEALADAAADLLDASVAHGSGDRPLLADLGGGTGYYSAHLLDRLTGFDGVLLDASTPAAKVAARAHPRLSVATADLWRSIPLADASVRLALVVFAPRNPAEIARILAPGGLCLLVTPLPDHLRELREAYGLISIDPAKDARLTEQFAAFRARVVRDLAYQVTLTADDQARVIAMGPNAFHSDDDQLPRVNGTESQRVTVAVRVHCFNV